ncbi:MAG: DUF5716 family protein [Eubacteriales bacterium]|nr:DUF5716 family protein [Eubacteriales bacterium]
MLFTKGPEKRYMVGFDLRETFCQISYYRNDGQTEAGREPVTFSQGGPEEFNIPAALCKHHERNQWFCGREALSRAESGEGTLVDHLLPTALAGTPVVIGEEEFDPCGLMALFIRRCFALLAEKVPTEQIAAVMFTAERMTKETAQLLADVRQRMELPVDHVCCETYANSFYNYMLMQPSSLREREVLLCEYDGGETLLTHRLVFNPNTTPTVAFMEKKEYPFARRQEGGAGTEARRSAESQPEREERAPLLPEEKDERFLAILGDAIGDRRPASAYLIGDGFKGGWMRKSLTYLCYQRRVFQGNNLYSKGAAYGALFRVQPPALTKEYFFLGKNKLKSNVGMQALRRGQMAYHAVLDAGENWYEVDKTEDYILESGNELRLIVTPLTGARAQEYPVVLDKLPVRAQRAARIRVRYTMPTPQTLLLRAQDLGFGEIYPASGLSWEQTLEV